MNCGNCHRCLENVRTEYGIPITATRMIVCAECGNKRCPKAADHELVCTKSNELEQPGSMYSNFNFKTEHDF